MMNNKILGVLVIMGSLAFSHAVGAQTSTQTKPHPAPSLLASGKAVAPQAPKAPSVPDIVFGADPDQVRVVVAKTTDKNQIVLIDRVVSLINLGENIPVQALTEKSFVAGCVKSGSKTKAVPGVVSSGVDLTMTRTGVGVQVMGHMRSNARIHKMPARACNMEMVDQETKSVSSTFSLDQLRQPILVDSWLIDGVTYTIMMQSLR